MKKYIGLIFILLLSGCMTAKKAPDLIDTGSSPRVIRKMVDTQRAAVEIIDTEATTILKTTKNDIVLDSTKSIIKENQRIALITDTLSTEADNKSDLIKSYKNLQADHNKLLDEKNSGFRRFFMMLKIFGALAIPIGIFLGTKLASEFYYITIGGVVVIILSSVVTFIEKHWLLVVGFMITGVLITLLRQYIVHGKATFEAVRVGEILKEKVKDIDADFITKLFGNGTEPGIIQQDNRTKKIITENRKKVLKEAKPTIEKV